MNCQDVATLPTPGLLSAHAAIGIGVCGDSCYVGLPIWLSMGYVVVDHNLFIWWCLQWRWFGVWVTSSLHLCHCLLLPLLFHLPICLLLSWRVAGGFAGRLASWRVGWRNDVVPFMSPVFAFLLWVESSIHLCCCLLVPL